MRKDLAITIGINALIDILAVGALFWKKDHDKKDLKEKEEELTKAIANAKDQANDISNKVDEAVRFVYDNEAKRAFDRKLQTINLEELATNICKRNLQKIEDSVIRKQIEQAYVTQIRGTMKDCLKDYFKDGIKKMVDDEIDTDFIRRMAKTCVKDDVHDILESEVEKMVRDCDVSDVMADYIDSHSTKYDASIKRVINDAVGNDIDDRLEDMIGSKLKQYDFDEAIESYLEENSDKFDAVIKKAINNVVRSQFDDSFVDRVIEAVEQTLEAS